MKIVVIGAGYVGLVTAAGLADFGHVVTCVDTNVDRIAALKAGRSPIVEPGLDVLLQTHASAGRLSFTQDMQTVLPDAEIVFLAVGTPTRGQDGAADLSFIHAAAAAAAPFLRDDAVLAVKSTVPVGTGDTIAATLSLARPEALISVVSNPEFLREGAAVVDFRKPDRLVVGAEDDRARAAMVSVYAILMTEGTPFVFTSRRSAELSKYASNAFLAMKVTFINEMADLAAATGGDVRDVARIMGLDARIGPRYLSAGPGFGGSCFPKDLRALLATSRSLDVELGLIETTVTSNSRRIEQLTRRIVAAADGSIVGKRVALLGLTFKPDTDDIRESPAVALGQALVGAGANLRAFDPEGMKAAQALLPGTEMMQDAYGAVDGADITVIATEWMVFRALDLGSVRKSMRGRLVVDLRNVFDPEEAQRHGFHYLGVGRPDIDPTR